MILIGPRHSSGAHDSRAPLEWRGPTSAFFSGRGVWHGTVGLRASDADAIGIGAVPPRVGICGTSGTDPTAPMTDGVPCKAREGVRAVWQYWRKMLARLQRITATVRGSGWQLAAGGGVSAVSATPLPPDQT